jgi:hypothetical protein
MVIPSGLSLNKLFNNNNNNNFSNILKKEFYSELLFPLFCIHTYIDGRIFQKYDM